MSPVSVFLFLFFFFNDTATTEIYTLSLHDALPIYVLPRTPGNNVYVGFMVWSNFTATKCRGLVSLNQVIKEIQRNQSAARSEERFSRNAETDLVCRLLLEKKKNNNK